MVVGDFLWFFHQMPYTQGASHYGHGQMFHFVDQLFYVIGLPFYIFLMVGLLAGFLQMIQRRLRAIEICIIYGGFVGFVMAHSLFWYLGIFDSMGLKRVLVGVLPLASLIALNGLNWLASFLNGKKLKVQFVFWMGLFALIFPFSGTPSSIHWQEFYLTAKQEQIKKLKLDPIFLPRTRVSTAYRYVYRDWETDRKSTRLNSSHRL